MTDPKPVELTDVERAALMHHIGGWKFERQGLASAEDAFMAEVSRIVAARDAAARREAEDDPAHARMYRALVERAERAESKVATARREALLEAREDIEVITRNEDRIRGERDAAEAKVARVEALAASAPWVPLRTDRAEVTRHSRMVKADDITAALAEPERDEESGR